MKWGKMTKIGVVLPTRGMVFSRTIEALEGERKNLNKDYETTLYISHNLPIPKGHNDLCVKALEDGNDYVLFVEEDCVIPTGAIEKLLAVNADIACIDYGVSGWSCITKNKLGEILWCGLGCTLVKRAVLEALQRPYFRVDKVLRLNDMTWQDLPESYIENKNYGTLDIWFFTKAREKGFKIMQIENLECDHLELISLGEKGKNHGIHNIGIKPKIVKHQII